MKHRPSNIVMHELIGLPVKVLWSPNESLIGLKGRVIDETMNLLVLETSKGIKKILKKDTILLFTLPGEIKVKVDGKVLVGRPEDRVKRIPKKRW